MNYSGSVITKEDFEREWAKRDRKLLEKLSKKLNGRWMAYNLGYDVDYDPSPAKGQNE
jgi:hypothetical protein